MKKKLLILFLLLFTQQLISTNVKTDSLSHGKDAKIPIPTLFELIVHYETISPEKAMVYSQQAIEATRRTKDLPGEALASFYLGKILRKTDNYAQALEKQQQAEALFRECMNDSMTAESRLEIGLNYFQTAEQEKAIDAFTKSLEFYKQQNDSNGIATAYYNIGRSHRKSGHLDTALKYSLSSLEYSPKNNHNALNTISIIHGMLGNLPEALAYQKQSLEIREALDLPEKIIDSLNNLGIISRLMENHEQSLAYYLQSIAVAEKIGKKSGLNRVLNNVGVTYADDLNQPEKALKYYQKSLKISQELNDKFEIANTLINIGFIQSKLKQYPRALENLQSGIALAEKIKATELLQNGYLTLSQHHQRLGNYKQSYENFKQYSTFRDSIINQKTQNKIAELQVKYESEKQKAENELYQLQLKQEKIHRMHIYGGLGLVIFLAVLLLFLYLNKIKINRILNQEISKRAKIEASLAARVQDQTKTLSEQLAESEKQRKNAATVLDELHKSTQKLRLEIAERTRQEKIQQSLYQISVATHITANMGEFFHIIQKKLGTILDTHNFFIAFYDKETDSISFPYFKDEKDKLDIIPAGKSCTAYVIRNKKPLLAKAEELQELARAGKIEILGTLAKIWLGVPININNECVGAVVIQSYHDENAYDERDLELFQFIANQIYLFIDHKRAEQKLRESNNRFKKLSSLTFEGILIHRDGIVSDTNESLERMFGYSRLDIIGQNIIQLCVPPEYHQTIRDSIIKKRATPYELMVRRKDGTLMPVEVEGREVTIDNVNYRVAAIRDITERKRNEAAKKESEEKFRILAETSPMAIMLYQNNRWIYANPAAEKMCGYTLAELKEMEFWSFVAPEYQEMIKQNGKARQSGLQPGTSYEFKIINKSGQEKWVALTGNTIKLAGINTGFITVNDINERKLTQEALHASENKMRSIFRIAPAGIGIIKNRILLELNPRFCDMLGFTKEELLNKNARMLYATQEDYEFVGQEKIRQINERGTGILETRWQKKDGKIIHILLASTPIVNNDASQGIIFTALDITEQKQTEETLSFQSMLLDQIQDNVTATDLEGRITYVNNAECRTFGKKEGDFRGQHIQIYGDDPEQGATQQEIIETTLSKGEWRGEVVNITEDGRRIVFDSRTHLIYNDSGNPVGMLGISTDITERKQAESALRASEERFRTIYENAPALIDAFDKNGRCVLWNKQCQKLFGWTMDELNAHDNILEVFYKDPVELKKVAQSIIHPGGNFFEWHPVTKDGKKLTTLWANFRHPDGNVIGLGYDITEQKQAEAEKVTLEKQLNRSQKLETIGTLAGGIAHDFNNILTPIIGYTDMVLSDQPPHSQIAEDLQHVLTGANRAKELVQQILTFSRQIEHERKPLKLHLIIKEALQLLRPSIPVTIQIQQQIDTSCEMVMADPSQIHQVIVNLCTNSYHAMEKTGGTLTIQMKQVLVDSITTKIHPNLEEKEYIQLSVCDTGVGMDATTIDHIFEPFFTTKSVGKGTGLGLSVTYGIIRSHHGEILVDSQPGRGSTFHVYLPVTKNESENDTKNAPFFQGGNESILVIDDEAPVTTLLKKMLDRLGYRVTAWNSSVEALSDFRRHPDTYDLVITDLTMPMMTGLDLAKELHKLITELPIILMTGYSESITGDILDQHGIDEIIEKPIELRKLANVIRHVFEK